MRRHVVRAGGLRGRARRHHHHTTPVVPAGTPRCQHWVPCVTSPGLHAGLLPKSRPQARRRFPDANTPESPLFPPS